jgi:hypothetical protein
MLAVIKDEKFGAFSKRLYESIESPLTCSRVDTQSHSHNLRHQVPIAEISKLDDRHADLLFGENPAGNRQCQTGLSDPARADQRQQPLSFQTAY